MTRRFVLCLLALGALLCWAAGAPTTLQVVDLRWTAGQPELDTWVGSLQGTINRQDGDTAIFVVRGPQDAAWADALVNTCRLKKEVLTPGACLALWQPRLTGQVLYDPAQPWTRAIALTAAAVAPGAVIATDRDRGLPTVIDLRAGWADRRQAYLRAAEQFGRTADAKTLALAPEAGHAFADLIAARTWLAVGLSPLEAGDADALRRLLAALPPGAQVVGHPGRDDAEASTVHQALLRLNDQRPLGYLPMRETGNLSCYARFPLARPLVQARDEAAPIDAAGTVALIYNIDTRVGGGAPTVDYAANTLPALLDAVAHFQLPVGVEVPTAVGEAAPTLYHLLLARQRLSAAELIAAPGADPRRALGMDLTIASVRGAPNEWPTAAAMQAVAAAGWQGAIVQPLARPDDPAWAAQGFGDFPVILASRVASVPELRGALAVLKGPNQVIYLDPDGIPPATLHALLPEIARTHTLVTPSQLFRGKREFDAIMAAVREKPSTKFRRRPPTLRVSAPAAPAEIGDDREVPVTVRIDGRAPVLAARVLYHAPDGRPGAADLRPIEGNRWGAVLPPMLTGGELVLRARVVESGGFGESISGPVSVKITGADADQDGDSDTMEAYRGSDPANPDTDGDGLPDGLDADSLRADRPTAAYLDPLVPPADAPLLADAGASTADADGRVIPAGGAVTYRVPVDGLPGAGVTLRLRTAGAGTVAVQGGAPQTLQTLPAEEAITDLRLGALADTLQVTVQAGAAPLRLFALELISSPEGPYLQPVEFVPAVPPGNVPFGVRVRAFSPEGIKAVRLRYGEQAHALKTLELTPAAGGGGVIFTGALPALYGGTLLVFGVEAEDTAGRVAASPLGVMPIGRTKKHSVALTGSRDLIGSWDPVPVWGMLGRTSTAGKAEDTHLFLARPGTYTAWVLAQPRQRGIAVDIAKNAVFERTSESKLSRVVPAGGADGWYRLGTFRADESQRLLVRVRPVGDAGYCAYGEVVLTQDEAFTPPLRYAGIDWHNSIILRGVTPGQTVGGTITVALFTTGNLDATSVIARQVRGTVSTLEDYPFTAKADGTYALDTRRLLPGEYEIVAIGWRVVTERDRRTRDPLVSTSVRVVVPAK